MSDSTAPMLSQASTSTDIQKMLSAEIDNLRELLDARFVEISALTRRLQELENGTDKRVQQQIADQERRHNVTITLLHALYASWHKGPAPGVASFMQQVSILEVSDLFDANWYVKTYPDVASSGFSAQEHYVRSGGFEGRNPGPKFDTMAYYLANPDVAKAGWPALVHYVGFGKAEGRKPA